MSRYQKLFILIGILVAITMIYNRPRVYYKDYYGVVNRAQNKSYEAIKNENGPIKKTEIIEDFEYIYYEDGRTFVFYIFPSGTKEFCRIDITSEQYRFGKKQIGLGTTRKQIETIYKKNINYADDRSIEVVEVNTSVTFYFNDQDVIYKMCVGEPDIYK